MDSNFFIQYSDRIESIRYNNAVSSGVGTDLVVTSIFPHASYVLVNNIIAIPYHQILNVLLKGVDNGN